MTRTITELEKDLNKIRLGAKKGKYQTGMFGIQECKKAIEWQRRFNNKSLEEQYGEYVKRALIEALFNEIMIVACEQLMNGESC